MAPHKVELDLDRKEELLIQKQLRACRVNIMPRNVDSCYKISSLSPSPSPRTPESPHIQGQPKVDSSPIAMRYWNQCQAIKDPGNANKGNLISEQDVVDELAMKMQKLAQQKVKCASQASELPTVPEIRNTIQDKKVPSSPKILITDADKGKVPQAGVGTSKINNNIETVKVLSTAGSGFSRENEKFEALANINRFITVDQLPNPEQFQQKERTPKAPLPPKLPFLNEIQLLKRSEPTQPLHNQKQTIPPLPVKTKLNAHIGHIENRPTFGDLPFLSDIKSIGEVMHVKENSEQNTDKVLATQHNTENSARSLPTVQDSAFVTEKLPAERLRQHMERTIESPSPKIVRFSQIEESQNGSKRNSYVETYKNGKEELGDENYDIKPTKPPKAKKGQKFNIKIYEKSNMSKLSDQIVPQLNTMQKNYLGLLFFNELSQNIVEDIVAQQLSMMPGTKLASVINSLEQQVCDTAVPLMLNSVSDDLRTALVCQTFGDLTTQDKAGVLFTTGDDVMEVCSTITDFGGRAFKKALIKNMIATEEKDFMDEVVQGHIKDQQRSKTWTNENNGARLSAYRDDLKQLSSADDENYNSAEESLADEYYDFESK